MKRLFMAIILCGLAFSISSCDKLGDDESDGGSTGVKPPGYKPYKIDDGIIYRDSILDDNPDFKQAIN